MFFKIINWGIILFINWELGKFLSIMVFNLHLADSHLHFLFVIIDFMLFKRHFFLELFYFRPQYTNLVFPLF
jgi:hypothetical protein